ncbi:MAG TPA: HNH endonuclease [Epulopiscium sp.]|nr:HNH endonuclease [Candidatus Epulonipiscium sp.]
MLFLPQESSIDVNLLERMQEENIVTSYKLFWFRGIFKEIISQNKEITFRRIVCRMIAEAWYPLIEYHLNFGAIDMLYDLCILIHRKYKIDSNISENKLLEFLEDLNDKEIERGIRNLYNMVPYRLLAPFFVGEFQGIADHRRNKKIAELSHSRDDVFYKINDKEKSIIINQNWFNYIYKNQSIVYGWMSYKLIYFLQNRNPNVPAIPFKLAAPQERNLAKARRFWNEVNDRMPLYDIYTSKELTERNFKEYGGLSIDHFIPWSFVLHDELWNLVPTFHNINSSKSNRLPNLEHYMEKFCDLQYNAFKVARKNKKLKKQLEDYLTINKNMDINALLHSDIQKGYFVDSIKATIKPLFQIAYNQGYGLWHEDAADNGVNTPSVTNKISRGEIHTLKH